VQSKNDELSKNDLFIGPYLQLVQPGGVVPVVQP
jgi:hypothetical protein